MAEKIEFDLEVGDNELDKALNSGIKKALNLENVLETALGVFAGNIATKGLELFTDGLQSIVDVAAKSIDAAAEQEVAVNNMNSALSRAGILTRETSKDLQEFAAQLQNSSTYGDDAALSTLAYLTSLTRLDKEGLKKATQASLDLASALGIDLQSATTLVAKAANGNISAFQRYGISIDKGTTSTETFANTLQALESQFGGAASQKLNTYSGAVQGLSNSYGDLFEPIGDVIVKNEEYIGLLNTTKDLINGLTTDIANNNSSYKELVSDGIFAAIASAKIFLDALDGITVVLKGSINFIEAFGASLSLGVVGPLKLAYDAVLLLLQNIPILGEAFEGLQNPLDSLTDTLVNNFNSALDDLNNSADNNVFRTLSDGADSFANAIIDNSEKVKLANQEIGQSNAERVNNEAIVSEEILKARTALNAELLNLQAQLASDQAAITEQNRAVDLEINGQKEAEDILRAAEFEVKKNEAIYQAKLDGNAQIEDAEQRRLANLKALRERDLADSKAIGKAEVDYKRALAAEEKAIFNSRIAATSAFLNLGQALAKEGSVAAKVLASANAVVQTYAGATQVLGDPSIPVLAKPAFVAATIANGLANVARINGVQFENGGVVGGANGASVGPDNRQATIRDGEMVLNAVQQKNLVDMLNNGVGGGDIVIQINEREIARAVRNQKQAGFVI